jgi:FdhD protein
MKDDGLTGVAQRRVRHADPGGPLSPEKDDAVAVEEPLEIRVAGEPVSVTMRTPGDDARLAVGFLYSEGIVRSHDDVGAVAHCGRPGEEGFGNVIDLTPAPGLALPLEKVATSRRGTLTTSACGVCGRRTVDDLMDLAGELRPYTAVTREVLAHAPQALQAAQANFARTGGVHAAAALDRNGLVLATFEDVGRHNAVDKVVGALVLDGRVSAARREALPDERSAALLVVSGRASFEIVQKAAMAGIPVVASVSAASTLAIDLAERAGVALASFVRNGSFNLHTRPDRISGLS